MYVAWNTGQHDISVIEVVFTHGVKMQIFFLYHVNLTIYASSDRFLYVANQLYCAF